MPPDFEWAVTGCATLDEELQQPLAIVIKLENSTDTSHTLTLPLLPDLIVHTRTDSTPALALYHPWGPKGWMTEAKGKLEVEVGPGAVVELLYLVPRFDGEATIELVNIGLFKIKATSGS